MASLCVNHTAHRGALKIRRLFVRKKDPADAASQLDARKAPCQLETGCYTATVVVCSGKPSGGVVVSPDDDQTIYILGSAKLGFDILELFSVSREPLTLRGVRSRPQFVGDVVGGSSECGVLSCISSPDCLRKHPDVSLQMTASRYFFFA